MNFSLVRKSSIAIALLLSGTVAAQDFNFNGTAGDGTSWEDAGNWTNGGGPSTLPPSSASDNVTLPGGGEVIDFDTDTWNFAVANSLLTGGATGEYRIRQLRAGLASGTGVSTINFDFGAGRTFRSTQGSTYVLGDFAGSNGTLNLNSGTVILEASNLRIGQRDGSAGLVNIDGSDSTFVIGRGSNNGGVNTSLFVGSTGSGSSDGTFQIANDATFLSRTGVQVNNGGVFAVIGSVAQIGIGSQNSLSGNWIQQTGGTLSYAIDPTAVESIFIDEVAGGAATFANFANGSLLDLSFASAIAPVDGTWTILEVENGDISDLGLTLAAGVDAGWTFAINNSGPNGILTATFSSIPEPGSAAVLLVAGTFVISRRRKRA